MNGRCGVVVAHGDLAQGFLSALTRVAGPQDHLWAISNAGLSGDALVAAVETVLDEHAHGREAFLFSDLGAGSCGQACRRLLDTGRVRAVFFGISLPLLIEFVFLEREPTDQLISLMLDKSRGALGVLA